VKQTFREDSGEYVIRTIDSSWLQTMRLQWQITAAYQTLTRLTSATLHSTLTTHNLHTDHSLFIHIMFYTMKSFNLHYLPLFAFFTRISVKISSTSTDTCRLF